ncbi:hypothetical protein BOTBODRAFT_38086 [Botryobasidium botryosum FD-172 SS1]|uniref:MYND-type domain-containing protein n=1 Tax=Botryobasidium botryosum (strain FD-172 SS1) TaxID=930990 RepID=A0A067LYD3_BOTB1|nr:hypothetical protein BOTBODRAFT_38086 [Botryobasidium botryosum FD-172 SS1]
MAANLREFPGITAPVTAATLMEAAQLDPELTRSDDGDEEFERMPVVRIKRQLGLLQVPAMAPLQIIVHHELAAKHLPTLMRMYRDSSIPNNAAMMLINSVSHTPYFVRFLQLAENADVCVIHARRTAYATFSAVPPHDLADTVAETCQFLSTLLVLQNTVGLAAEDKLALTRKLRAWSQQYRNKFAEEVSERALMLLGPRVGETASIVNVVRTQLEKGISHCKARNCDLTGQNNGGELLMCSKCRTVRYCGAQHQRQDWPSHKKVCFTPAF